MLKEQENGKTGARIQASRFLIFIEGMANHSSGTSKVTKASSQALPLNGSSYQALNTGDPKTNTALDSSREVDELYGRHRASRGPDQQPDPSPNPLVGQTG